jgi:hypothetical protein
LSMHIFLIIFVTSGYGLGYVGCFILVILFILCVLYNKHGLMLSKISMSVSLRTLVII